MLLLAAGIATELMKQGAMMTVLSRLLIALAWPAALLSATNFIDSTWSIAVDRFDLLLSFSRVIGCEKGKNFLPVSFY